MAGFNESVAADSKWYDPANNPGELHDDLRRDYVATRHEVQRRPSLVRHMQACEVCQAISAAQAAAPAPSAGRKRLKFVLTKARMHQALGLPENVEIVHMWANNDPCTVTVLVAGEGLPTVDDDVETPTGRLDEPGDV
jgi:hypothetical protein